MERDESWGGKWENKTDSEKMIDPSQACQPKSQSQPPTQFHEDSLLALAPRPADQPFQRSDAWQNDREEEIKTVMPFPRAKTRSLSDAAAGYSSEIHLRPPYCKKLFALPWYLSQTGRKTIIWDVEPDSSPSQLQSQPHSHGVVRQQDIARLRAGLQPRIPDRRGRR
jgi:hypothetical protein